MKAVYIDHMGTDLSVVRAAKVSMANDKTVQSFIDDIEAKKLGCRSHAALLRYLARHNHWTPYAHTAISLRVTAPVPIRTQCFKHKQGFVENEESRRYISSIPELFIPDEFRQKAESVKQGSGGVHPDSEYWKNVYWDHCSWGLTLYEEMLVEGICPEQARFVLPQGVEVNWIWTGNLAAFARYFCQRTEPHAQKESQDLAKEIGEILSDLFPYSWKYLTTPEATWDD
ncbi:MULTISPECIES: FAD-dependent thymidylate synthase [unclassified Thioalkalivibrio]|uniref:FAD-dependent thymidylate synthase n=1 Tax=unclassified Thioalkalivibrio TaxID=2621013 RepID=UPI000361C422|nr:MULTISPECIES: FAD-dependent thymidylate synthase [unclassified Thioalkalivibrio]